MDLRQLEALDAVIETGSFTAAAKARHLTQPALWAQVRGLEDELGVPLFERSGRGVVPTRACLLLRPRVRAALDSAQSVAAFAGEIRAGRATPARIGCAQYHVPHFLADCIADLQAGDPKAPFPVIVPVTSTTASPALADGVIDLVVHARDGRMWEGFPLYDVFVAVVGPRVATGPFDVRKLAGRRIVTLPRDSAVRTALEDTCREAGVELEIVHEDRDAPSLLALAARGLATAVVISEALGPADLERVGRLVDGKRALGAALWLQWRSEASLPPSARALRDCIRERAARLGSTKRRSSVAR